MQYHLKVVAIASLDQVWSQEKSDALNRLKESPTVNGVKALHEAIKKWRSSKNEADFTSIIIKIRSFLAEKAPRIAEGEDVFYDACQTPAELQALKTKEAEETLRARLKTELEKTLGSDLRNGLKGLEGKTIAEINTWITANKEGITEKISAIDALVNPDYKTRWSVKGWGLWAAGSTPYLCWKEYKDLQTCQKSQIQAELNKIQTDLDMTDDAFAQVVTKAKGIIALAKIQRFIKNAKKVHQEGKLTDTTIREIGSKLSQAIENWIATESKSITDLEVVTLLITAKAKGGNIQESLQTEYAANLETTQIQQKSLKGDVEKYTDTWMKYALYKATLLLHSATSHNAFIIVNELSDLMTRALILGVQKVVGNISESQQDRMRIGMRVVTAATVAVPVAAMAASLSALLPTEPATLAVIGIGMSAAKQGFDLLPDMPNYIKSLALMVMLQGAMSMCQNPEIPTASDAIHATAGALAGSGALLAWQHVVSSLATANLPKELSPLATLLMMIGTSQTVFSGVSGLFNSDPAQLKLDQARQKCEETFPGMDTKGEYRRLTVGGVHPDQGTPEKLQSLIDQGVLSLTPAQLDSLNANFEKLINDLFSQLGACKESLV